MKPLLIILLIFFSSAAYTQNVKGIVKDESTKAVLMRAIVAVKNAKGGVISYTASDNDGRFQISTDKTNDSSYLEVSFIGYEKSVVKLSNEEDELEIYLKPKPERIEEAVVKAEPVKTRGDTISFSVPTLISKDDRNLSDFLRKLPGVEVNKEGYVMYRGKHISKFYIDGKDFLDSKYNVATQNLNPENLSEVEIFENHQHIKALEGIGNPDRAALNIKLKEGVKSKWIGILQAIAGYSPEPPTVPYTGAGFIMNISNKFQTMNTLKTDAAGNNILPSLPEENVYVLGEVRKNPYRLNDNIYIGMLRSPIGGDRARFNTTYSATTDNKFSVGKNLGVGLSATFAKDKQSAYNSITQIYDLQDGTYNTFTENNSSVSDILYAEGGLNLSINTKKVYFDNDLIFDIKKKNIGNQVDNEGVLSQDGSTNDININNILRYIHRFNEDFALELNMKTQYSEKEETLSVFSSEDDSSAEQNIAAGIFYNELSFNIRKEFGQYLRLLAFADIDFLNREFNSSLVGTPPSIPFSTLNNIDMYYFKPKGTLLLEYNKDKIKTNVFINAWYQYLDYSEDLNQSIHKFAVSPSLLFQYNFTKRFYLKANTSFSLSPIDDQSIYDGVIMNNYKFLTKGREELTQNPSYFVSGELNYNNPISGWTVEGRGSYSYKESFESTRYFIDDYIINVESDDVVFYKLTNAHLLVSKGLYDIAGKLGAKIGYANINSIINQNGIESPYVSHRYSASLDFTGEVLRWWKIDYRSGYDFNRYKINGDWQKGGTHSLIQNMKFSIFPTSFLEIEVGAEHYLDVFSNQDLKHLVLFDASLWYFINKNLQLFLHAKNIFDEREYSYSILSPLNLSHYSYKIRPFNIVLGIEFKF